MPEGDQPAKTDQLEQTNQPEEADQTGEGADGGADGAGEGGKEGEGAGSENKSKLYKCTSPSQTVSDCTPIDKVPTEFCGDGEGDSTQEAKTTETGTQTDKEKQLVEATLNELNDISEYQQALIMGNPKAMVEYANKPEEPKKDNIADLLSQIEGLDPNQAIIALKALRQKIKDGDEKAAREGAETQDQRGKAGDDDGQGNEQGGGSRRGGKRTRRKKKKRKKSRKKSRRKKRGKSRRKKSPKRRKSRRKKSPKRRKSRKR